MPEESLEILQPEDLEEIASLLSEESYQNIKKEMKSMVAFPPSAAGLGVEHLNYIPRTYEECMKKLKHFEERYAWGRQLCAFSEMIIVDQNRTIRGLKKENKKLNDKIKDLEDDVKRLKNQLLTALGIKSFSSSNTQKNKEQKQEKSKGKRKRGAPKGHIGRTRPIPDSVDKVEEVLPSKRCPVCNSSHILISDEYISKYIEDILPITKFIEEIKYRWGHCKQCSHKFINQKAYEGPPVKIGDSLISTLAIMRQQMGISYRKLSKLSTDFCNIPLTPSGVLGIINRVSQKLEPIYNGIEASLRQMPVLWGDETGWKMDGKRWYMWCFCNKNIVYYCAKNSRGSKVPKALLGIDYEGILHADFYASYNFLPQTQRCLVHFLRSINEELEISQENKDLLKLKTGLKNIIKKGNEIKYLPDSSKKSKLRQKLEKDLISLTDLKSNHKKVKTFIKRIIRYQENLLRFVDNPEVDYHNNWAEQILRWVVIFRKLSFGNRTVRGARNFSVLASVLETLRLQGKNQQDFILAVLKTPPNSLNPITCSLFDTS